MASLAHFILFEWFGYGKNRYSSDEKLVPLSHDKKTLVNVDCSCIIEFKLASLTN